MVKTIKQKVILLLCAVMAACMALGGAAVFSRKANAEEVTEKYIVFNEPNAVCLGSNGNVSYILYDTDSNGQQSNGESYIYPNNRFVPGTNYDAVLLWTAQTGGTVSCSNGTIALNNSENRDSSTTTDGIRWSLLKVGTDNKCTKLTDDFYNSLEFKAKEKTTASFSISDLSIECGEKIAIVVNCGENKKNTWDETTITVTLSFKSTDSETATEYAFNSTCLTAHANALNGPTEYTLASATTNYYSWGASTFSEKQTLTADVETSTFTQTNVMNGKTETNLIYKGGNSKGQWNLDGGVGNYHVAITGSVAKICAMSEFNDTQLVWKAPENGVFSLDSLSLVMEDTSSSNPDAVSDGMKFAVLYKNSEGKYFDLYTANEIAGDAPWHDLEWKATAIAITDLSDFAMQKDEEFIVMFNRKNTNTLDSCKFDITISFAADGGEAKEYIIKQGTAAVSAQGVNNFYFRTVSYLKTVIYKQNNAKIKQDAYSEEYALSGGEVVALKENEQFVGWRLSDSLYKAGSVYTYSSDNAYITFEPVIITLKMQAGAGLRISTDITDAGLRFSFDYDLTGLKTSEYVFGTIVAVSKNITADTLKIGESSDIKIGNIPAVNYKTNDDRTFTQQAVVPYTSDTKNYATEITARGYVTVTYKDGNTATFYSDLSDSRSVAYVADTLYSWFEETFKTAPEYERLKLVVDSFKSQYTAPEENTENA